MSFIYETVDYRTTIFCIHLWFAFGVSTSPISRNLLEDSVVSGKHTWSSLNQLEHFISLTKVIDSGAVSNLHWLIQSESQDFCKKYWDQDTFLSCWMWIRKRFPLTRLASILGKQSVETEGNWVLSDIIEPINQDLPEARAISSLFNYVSH